MKINLRIPLNLFQIDLENSDEKEQLKYYKNKSLKLEEIIKLNDLSLREYVMGKFHKNSIFTIFSQQQLIEHHKLIERHSYGLEMYVNVDVSKYKLIKNKNIWFPASLIEINESKLLNTDKVKENLYFKLSLKQNSLILNASFALNLNILQNFEYRGDDQKLLNRFSKDTIIGRVKNYDLLNTYHSKEIFVIYFQFDARNQNQNHYGCNNFYRFDLTSDGNLILKYLYSIEYQKYSHQNQYQYDFKKIRNPQIIHSPKTNQSAQINNYQKYDHHDALIAKLMKVFTIQCSGQSCSVNPNYPKPFFTFNTKLMLDEK